MLLLLLICSALCVSSVAVTTDSSLTLDATDCITEDPHAGRDFDTDDPVSGFRITGPKDGAVETTPMEVRLFVNATSLDEFNAYYAGAHICVELNRLWKKCKVTGGPPIVFRLLPEGNYTAIAYIADKAGETRYHETTEVRFTVVGLSEFNLRNALLAQRSRKEQRLPEDIDLLRWAELETRLDSEDREEDDNLILPRTSVASTNSPMLVIGVKSAVVANFPRRQAIRETWANPATLPHDVKVLFLGCEPNMTGFRNDNERRRIIQGLAKERTAYKDLLTEELECTDSYRNLTNKVKSFMHLAVAEFPDAKFVMLVDDDVYVKVNTLAEHLRFANFPRLYFGEVWADKFANKQEPIRDPDSKYYLPEGQYPMRGLLPYVSGPHCIVSMDGVRFIAKNYWKLRAMNGLDDLSLGSVASGNSISSRQSRGKQKLLSRFQLRHVASAPEFNSDITANAATASTKVYTTNKPAARGIRRCF
ncbi:hypothetical protein ON010_g4896 [Phytophthora cinnamomi]|nr:hypothetical protein ON010_g4896 [Phytophthora cinnamomi]